MNPSLAKSFAGCVGWALRLAVVMALGWFTFCWPGKDAPILEFSDIRYADGPYKCILSSGGKYGPSGPDIVDGIEYHGEFSYFFGVHSPAPCVSKLNGHQVRIYYLRPKNYDKYIALELVDLASNQIYGTTRAEAIRVIRHAVEDRTALYLFKVISLILIVRVAFWRWLVTRLKGRGYGISS